MRNRIFTATLLAGLVIGVTGASLVSSASAGPKPASPLDKQAVTGAAASASTTVRVRGTQVPIDADKGIYATRGDLVGRWTFIPKKTLHQTPQLFVESGVERFNGCLDRNHDKTCATREPHGVLRSAYLYWASFDGHGKLLRGQCVHPVTGGTRDFANARGLLQMFDTPVGDAVRTTYRGRLVLRTALAPASGQAPRAFDPTAGSAPTRHAC
jgi:hypothetical protein